MKTFSIPEENMQSLEKKLTRIANKCKKYGNDFTFEKIGEHMGERVIEWTDWEGKYHKTIVPVKYIDIRVDGKAEVNGWQYVASLEHTNEGNIIRGISNLEVPKRYYDCAPYCEHCRTNRQRKDSFIIYKAETSEFKQVGKSCLKDFTFGMSAEAVAQFESAIKEAEEARDNWIWYGGFIPYIKTIDYATYVAEAIRIFGYVKRDNYSNTMSTAELAYILLRFDNDMIRNKDEREGAESWKEEALSKGWDEAFTMSKPLAETVINWIVNNDRDDNYFHNLKVACKGEYIACRDEGLVASAFPAYNRQLEWDAEKRDREAKLKDEQARSTWAGNVGERLSFTIADIRAITSWESDWGTVTVYKLQDTNGLTYTWKTSAWVDVERDIGKTCKGTVKEHKEFRGVKQTELTRCKIA